MRTRWSLILLPVAVSGLLLMSAVVQNGITANTLPAQSTYRLPLRRFRLRAEHESPRALVSPGEPAMAG